jgi:hypothetical protein
MTKVDNNQDSPDRPLEEGSEGERPGAYPTNHVVGVIDTCEEVGGAIEALSTGGFLDSEIHILAGEAAAEALETWSGRTGRITNLLIHAAELLGVQDDEMSLRERYGQALRDGRYVVAVAAPTETRKELATRILGEHGGHAVTFMGRFAIEQLIPRRRQ